MGYTGPYHALTPYRPAGSLLTLPVIFSVYGAFAI